MRRWKTLLKVLVAAAALCFVAFESTSTETRAVGRRPSTTRTPVRVLAAGGAAWEVQPRSASERVVLEQKILPRVSAARIDEHEAMAGAVFGHWEGRRGLVHEVEIVGGIERMLPAFAEAFAA